MSTETSFFSMPPETPETNDVDIPDDVIDTPDVDIDAPDDIDADADTETAQEAPSPKPNNSYIDSMANQDVEKLAKEIGWNPSGKKTAKEWLKNANNYVVKTKDVMESMQKEIATIKELSVQQVKTAREQERNNLKSILRKLELEKEEAFDLSDKEAFNDKVEQEEIVKQKLAQYEQQEKQFEAQPQHSVQVVNSVKQFVDANPWYENDKVMKVRYDSILQGYLDAGVDILDALNGAKEDLELRYPDKIKTVKTTVNPPRGDVLSGVSSQRQSDSLTTEQRSALNSQLKDFKEYFPKATKEQLDKFTKTTIQELRG